MKSYEENCKKEFFESIDRFVTSLNAIKEFAERNDLTANESKINEIIRRSEIDFSIALGNVINQERMKYSNVRFLFDEEE